MTTMITELYEAYSLEEGDELVIQGDIYRIMTISPADIGYRIMIVGEDAMVRMLDCDDTRKFNVICDVDHTESS